MLAFGALLTCAAVLALAALIVALRGPNPPRWITRHWAQELATVVLVCALAFGPAAVAAGAIRTYEGGANFLDLGLLGAVLLATVWIWRKLDLRHRLRALEARPGPAAPGPVPTAAISAAATHATEPPPPRPSKPTRRAA